MATILQGTTPALRIGISADDFLVSDVSALEIVVWQDTPTADGALVYGLEDVNVDTEANAFEIRFTEADTLALNPALYLYWQMRCKFPDGSIVGTAVSEPIRVANLKSEEALT